MRRALFVLLIVFGLVLAPIPVGADEGVDVSGDWTYVPTYLEFVERDGPNIFALGGDIGTWTGGFVGTTTEDFVLVHSPAGGYNLYSGELRFEGAVEDADGVLRSGTMTMQTHGKQDPGTLEPSDSLWVGHWSIVSGTGELEGIQGHGRFVGPSFDLDYWGTVYFDS